MSQTVNHSALISTMAGSCPSLTYITNVRTVSFSGVSRMKYGVTYCTPQRILICGSGFFRKRGVGSTPLEADSRAALGVALGGNPTCLLKGETIPGRCPKSGWDDLTAPQNLSSLAKLLPAPG